MLNLIRSILNQGRRIAIIPSIQSGNCWANTRSGMAIAYAKDSSDVRLKSIGKANQTFVLEVLLILKTMTAVNTNAYAIICRRPNGS